MTHLHRILLAFLVVVCCVTQGQAQQAARLLVSGSFKAVTLEEFAQAVEAQTHYQFYFDAAAVDSLFVTLEAKEQPLSALLSQIFRNTDFQFSIDDRERVFISKGRQLSVQLPEDFFEPMEVTAANAPQVAALQTEEKEAKKAGSELKLYAIGVKRENATGKANLAGHIRESKSGEARHWRRRLHRVAANWHHHRPVWLLFFNPAGRPPRN